MAASTLEAISKRHSHDLSSGVWRNTSIPRNPREARLVTRYWMLYAAHVLEAERAEIFHPIIREALRGIARGLDTRPLSPISLASSETESPFLVGWMLGSLGPIDPSGETQGLPSPTATLEKLRRAGQKGGRARAQMRQATTPNWARFRIEADAENDKRKDRGDRPFTRLEWAKRLKREHALPHKLSSIVQLLGHRGTKKTEAPSI